MVGQQRGGAEDRHAAYVVRRRRRAPAGIL